MGTDDSSRRSEAAQQIDPKVSAALSLSVRLAQQNVLACATLLRNAGAALDDDAEPIAMDHLLDVEPLLFEAQTVLNAASILRRRAREGAFDKD